MDQQINPSCSITFCNDINRPAMIATSEGYDVIAPSNTEWYSILDHEFYKQLTRVTMQDGDTFYFITRQFKNCDPHQKIYRLFIKNKIADNETFTVPLSSLDPYKQETNYAIDIAETPLQFFVTTSNDLYDHLHLPE